MNDLAGITHYIARVTLDRLTPLLKSEDERGPRVMDLYMLPDRVIVAIDPLAIRAAGVKQAINPGFAKALSASLQGRRVEPLGDGGIYLQIAYHAERNLFPRVPLDLSKQPGPLYIPVGVRKRAVWKPLSWFAPALVGGAMRRGKTYILHGFIMALLHGGECEVYAWDGKNGAEFGRYGDDPHMHHFRRWEDLADELKAELARRSNILVNSNFQSIELFNQAHGLENQILPICLIVDEAAFIKTPEGMQAAADFVARGGYCGIYPIFGTQYPNAETLNRLVTANLLTRVALRVGDAVASRQILGHGGAEKLPIDIKGRFLIDRSGHTLEVQAFWIDPPGGETLTAEEIADLEQAPPPEHEPIDETPREIKALAEKIRFAWVRGASDSELARIAGGRNAGKFHYDLQDAKAYLENNYSSSTSTDDTQGPVEE